MYPTPFIEPCSVGTVKQSPAPQHHSPAALRNPPRLIQVSCADASEPIADNAPTAPTRAIARTFMVVPPQANAPLGRWFLKRRYSSFAVAVLVELPLTNNSPRIEGNFTAGTAFDRACAFSTLDPRVSRRVSALTTCRSLRCAW